MAKKKIFKYELKKKTCLDCGKDKKTEDFYIYTKRVSTKGKGVKNYRLPYCTECQYKRNKKSLIRSEDNVKKWKAYQKKYNKAWQQKYRNKKTK